MSWRYIVRDAQTDPREDRYLTTRAKLEAETVIRRLGSLTVSLWSRSRSLARSFVSEADARTAAATLAEWDPVLRGRLRVELDPEGTDVRETEAA